MTDFRSTSSAWTGPKRFRCSVRRFGRAEQGGVLVEFAVIAGFLVLVGVLIAEVGRFLFTASVLETALLQASRANRVAVDRPIGASTADGVIDPAVSACLSPKFADFLDHDSAIDRPAKEAFGDEIADRIQDASNGTLTKDKLTVQYFIFESPESFNASSAALDAAPRGQEGDFVQYLVSYNLGHITGFEALGGVLFGEDGDARLKPCAQLVVQNE